MSGGISKEGSSIYVLGGKLPQILGDPRAHSSASLNRFVLAPAVGTLTPGVGAQTVTGDIVSGGAVEYTFDYTDGTYAELFSFEVQSDLVLDILLDNDTGTILANPSRPGDLATSRKTSRDGLRSCGTPVSSNKNGIYCFTPALFGQGVGTYRLRVRGIPSIHPYFRTPTTLGRTPGSGYQVTYWKHSSDTRMRFIQTPECARVGDATRFVLRPTGVYPSGLTVDWDFGDGNTATGLDLLDTSNVFAAPGTYTVTATIQSPVPWVESREILVFANAPEVTTVRAFGFGLEG